MKIKINEFHLYLQTSPARMLLIKVKSISGKKVLMTLNHENVNNVSLNSFLQEMIN